MKQRLVTLLCIVFVHGAMASQAVVVDSDAPASGASCGSLMTEPECLRHREILAALTDPAARRAYLDQHMALMREREVLCACTARGLSLARAFYR